MFMSSKTAGSKYMGRVLIDKYTIPHNGNKEKICKICMVILPNKKRVIKEHFRIEHFSLYRYELNKINEEIIKGLL